MITDEANGATPAPKFLAGTRSSLETPLPSDAQRALTFGLLLSAARCTVQYILLPFVLPWIGIASSIPPWITLVLGAVAIASLTRNVRSLWRTCHARRWSYLAIALLVGGAIMVFMVMDVRALLAL